MAFENQARAKAYWDKNVKLMITLMVVWFMVSFGCGILFVDELNQFQLVDTNSGFGLLNKALFMPSSGLFFITHGRCARSTVNSA
ncbi:hypothetical protein AND4_04051 [Vibrio sp. AND4]|nr:hypothetical protein AND4_04051 [Vibrio sp. AND4]